MWWKRSAYSLLGALLCTTGLGCSAVNVLVSTPPGYEQKRAEPQRLVAIARVFENQGHLDRAESMYRSAVKMAPGDQAIRERLNTVVAMRRERSFGAGDRATEQALASADAVTSKRSASASPAARQQTPTAVAPESEDADVVRTVAASSASDSKAASESSDTKTADATLPRMLDAEEDLAAAFAAAEAAIESSVDSQEGSSDTSAALAANSDDGTSPLQLTDEEVASVDSPEQSETASGVVAAGFETIWTLDRVAELMDNPAEHTIELTSALKTGVDEDARAVAAALLADCPADDPASTRVLREAAENGSPVLQVVAVDTLLQRGEFSSVPAELLESLLTSENAMVRSSAVLTVRQVIGTPLQEVCVPGVTELLKSDSDTDVRAVAAGTLGDFLAAGADGIRSELMAAQKAEQNEAVLKAIEVALTR